MKEAAYKILLITSIVFLGSFQLTDQKPRIFLIGDSTTANKVPTVAPETGWGMIFPQYINLEVQNHAVNGRSTKSFRTLGHWSKVYDQLRAGDWVFIQFGHNDQKASDTTRYAAAQTDYRANLVRYIEEIRSKGANPLLITPVMRRKFDEQGNFVDQHGEYPSVVKDVGQKHKVPVLDLHAKSHDVIVQQGVEGSKKLFLILEKGPWKNYPEGKDDNTHFSAYGASVMASLVAGGIRELNLDIAKALVTTSGKYAYEFPGDASVKKDFPSSFTVKVTNPSTVARQNVFVYIPEEQLKKNIPDFNAEAFRVLDKDKEIASQYNVNDQDYRGVVTVLDVLNAGESREITVRYNRSGESKGVYTQRTQAELSHKVGGEWVKREYKGGAFKNVESLRVPPEHKDHSWFIRYEGPGWESDKVGYRFYLDQRNAADVFGKKTSDMVLQQVGLDGFDSYHNMQPWGMDVMKVGKSLGVGSIGSFYNGAAIRVEKTDSVNCRITENGDVYSSILTNYYGWQVGSKKYNVHSRITIHAGTRLTHQFLTVTGDPENICTGIVKDKLATLRSSKGDAQHFGYIATYGKQSLNDDQLGMAVFFHPKQVIEFTGDADSHIVTFKPSQGKVEYYFMGAWEQEPDGIKDEKQFIAYLDTVAGELARPVKVEFSKSKK